MNYELFMDEALAEARSAMERGERPNAAVAVVGEAMVVRAHDRVQETNNPTAHAVIVVLREAARKLGAARLADATIFTTQEPCAMCVGALLESDVEASSSPSRTHRRCGRLARPRQRSCPPAPASCRAS
jgi:tRNA(adenine34) deaminase